MEEDSNKLYVKQQKKNQINLIDDNIEINNTPINIIPKDKNKEFDNLCLGIDFGTTNSCLSIWYNNKSIIITDIDGSDTIPTVIEINSDKKIIGKQAYLRKEIFENSDKIISKKNIFLIYEIKKLLGKKFSELNKNQINMLAYDIKSDNDDQIIIIDSLTGKSYYPEEIAIHLFMSFKLRAEMFLSKKFNSKIIIKNSVISVPAYFNKNQRQIIKNSAEHAGFKVLRLINEPTAAAVCYGLGKVNKTNNAGMDIIVFDFGGGTLDVSLLNINDEVYEVLGSCGNNNLGGSDFDTKLMEYFIKEFIKENKIENYEDFISRISENSLHKLKLLCEQAKISLSDNTNTRVRIDDFFDGLNLNISLSREKFNEICQDLIRLIVKPLCDILNLCEKNKSEIDEIIMVGGMTQIPIVRYNIETFFNKDVNCSINPDNVVSIGASIHGFMLLNNTCIQDKLLLIDRTSLSIGLETTGGIMDVLIPRGSIIPIKKTKKYSTDTDFLDSINIKIFEGERKFTRDNFLIGNFILSGIDKQKKGIPSIQITFSIDSDGIIKIYAEDLDNPLNKKSIQVSGNKQNLSPEQIEQIIYNAKLMDQNDKIDKNKKESYITIIENSEKILENLSGNTIKIPQEIKENIISNVSEILHWLKSTDYNEISIDKYKEIKHDYKINYSIYIIQQSTPIVELDAANLEEEKDKGIEIYDEDINTKIYEEQINYIRKIIDEYDNIGKQIKIIKFVDMSKSKLNSDSNLDNKLELEKVVQLEQLEELEILFDEILNFASDNLLNFFIEKNLSSEFVDDIISKLYNLDVNFKNKFNLFNDEFNVISKLINKIEEKENYYLNLLEKIEQIEINKQIEEIDDINNKMKIDDINEKLEIILEFQTTIYKMNSGYINSDIDKISSMLNTLENL